MYPLHQKKLVVVDLQTVQQVVLGYVLSAEPAINLIYIPDMNDHGSLQLPLSLILTNYHEFSRR